MFCRNLRGHFVALFCVVSLAVVPLCVYGLDEVAVGSDGVEEVVLTEKSSASDNAILAGQLAAAVDRISRLEVMIGDLQFQVALFRKQFADLEASSKAAVAANFSTKPASGEDSNANSRKAREAAPEQLATAAYSDPPIREAVKEGVRKLVVEEAREKSATEYTGDVTSSTGRVLGDYLLPLATIKVISPVFNVKMGELENNVALLWRRRTNSCPSSTDSCVATESARLGLRWLCGMNYAAVLLC